MSEVTGPRATGAIVDPHDVPLARRQAREIGDLRMWLTRCAERALPVLGNTAYPIVEHVRPLIYDQLDAEFQAASRAAEDGE